MHLYAQKNNKNVIKVLSLQVTYISFTIINTLLLLGGFWQKTSQLLGFLQWDLPHEFHGGSEIS